MSRKKTIYIKHFYFTISSKQIFIVTFDNIGPANCRIIHKQCIGSSLFSLLKSVMHDNITVFGKAPFLNSSPINLSKIILCITI